MKQIKTAGNDIVCVEIPEEVINWQSLDVSLDWSKHKILGKLSELIDEDCEEFVKLLPSNMYKNYKWPEDKVRLTGIQPINATAKQSFISLLQSEGIDTNKNLLIIEVL